MTTKIPGGRIRVAKVGGTQRVYPASTAPQSVTGNATAYVSGAWVQLVAATVADAYLTEICFGGGYNGTSNYTVLEVGVGAAGSEVPVANAATVGTTASSGTTPGRDTGPALPIPAFIPAGSRVSVRIRSNGAQTAHVFVRLVDAGDLVEL